MERVFLSYSFRPEDRDPAQWVRTVIESHGMRPVTGDVLGGEQLSDKVKKRIEAADAFVGIWTRRDPLGGDPETFTTSDWLRDETVYARSKDKPTIVLLESGVSVVGMGEGHERIPFDRSAPLPAILRLARTLASWRDEYGRMLRVRLTPEEVARAAARPNARYVCRYRLHDGPNQSDWADVEVVRQAGGVFAFLPNVADRHLYELWLTLDDEDWQAPASTQEPVASLELVS
ncbi:MAG: toll/interleukin-1 receptor domain-containing protein [Sandaracinaceae bacterium]